MSRSTSTVAAPSQHPQRCGRRSRRGHWGLGICLALAFAVSPLVAFAGDRVETIRYDMPGPFPSLSRDYRLRDEHRVVITDQALSPTSVLMSQGESISWLSASGSPSRIVFEREVARSLVCHSLVNFQLEEDELRSADLNAGDTASFCELAPGRYRYRVVRRGHGEAHGMGGARRLDGWIVVSPRPVAATQR